MWVWILPSPTIYVGYHVWSSVNGNNKWINEREWVDLAARHPTVNFHFCFFPPNCVICYLYLGKEEDVSIPASEVEVREEKGSLKRHRDVSVPGSLLHSTRPWARSGDKQGLVLVCKGRRRRCEKHSKKKKKKGELEEEGRSLRPLPASRLSYQGALH